MSEGRVSNTSFSAVVCHGILAGHEPANGCLRRPSLYVTEPYGARQQYWIRSAPRLPIDLSGSLGHQEARFIDISERGIGCVVPQVEAGIGAHLPISIMLPGGASVTGCLNVRSVSSLNGSGWRVGGTTTWSETEWLTDFTPNHAWKALKV